MLDRIRTNMAAIRHKIVVMSGKGGVGKSTVAANLAIGIQRAGKSVGLMDVDLTNPNIPKMFGIEGRRLAGEADLVKPIEVAGVAGGGTDPDSTKRMAIKVVSTGLFPAEPDQPIVWRGPIKQKMIQNFIGDVVWGELDYLVIDLPPGTSDEPLSIAQEIPGIDGTIVVTTPQEVSIDDNKRSLNFAKSLNLKVLGVVENMSGFTCDPCGTTTDIFRSGGGERLADELDVPFLGRIPMDVRVMTGGDSGRPFMLAHEGPAAAAFDGIVAKVLDTCEKNPPVVAPKFKPMYGPGGSQEP
ncbi:MAG: Mrp/NBP35 family ATP-binding protein [Euryarchaeota archaeon]|nr:Mrp/NBP35 family ATP-binding protein [Euryarchaeota archaeon]